MDHEIPKLDPRFTHELRRVLNERDAHCPRCKYDLSGVPGPRCPECGKNISYYLRVADTTPWRLPEMRRRAWARLIGRVVVGAAAGVGALVCLAWVVRSLMAS